jgi:hypothetical protein
VLQRHCYAQHTNQPAHDTLPGRCHQAEAMRCSAVLPAVPPVSLPAPAVTDCSNPNNSKYYLIVVQVSSRLGCVPVPVGWSGPCGLECWLSATGPPMFFLHPAPCCTGCCTHSCNGCRTGCCTVPLQYTARLNAEKLKSHIYKLSGGSVAKKHYNMRLAPEAVSGGWLAGCEDGRERRHRQCLVGEWMWVVCGWVDRQIGRLADA